MGMDRFDKVMIALLAFCFIILVLCCVGAVYEDTEFMQECQQHEPHYRCQAMLRGGSTAQAVPVIIPTR